jgi:transcriptional regulator with XRE-family HTH domain
MEQGRSISGLARMLNLDKSHLSKVERGLEGLSPEKMRRLAIELKIPMDRLAPELAQMKADRS